MADNGEFVQSIRDATAKIALDMEKKVSQACLVVEGEARQLCPVDQGHLRASITSETEITADEIIGRIGSNLEYAPLCAQRYRNLRCKRRRKKDAVGV